MRAAWLLTFLPLAGCARLALENSTPRGLETGLALRELPRRGAKRGLTSADGNLDAVSRSADGRNVDLDSDLEIVPLTEVIRGVVTGDGDGARGARADALRADIAELAGIVEMLSAYTQALEQTLFRHAEVLDARARGVDSSTLNERFRESRAVAADLEIRIIDAVLARPRAAVLGLSTTARNDLAADFSKLGDFMNGELARLREEQEAFLDAVTYKLRLEGFLRSPGKEPMPVHLPGYDSLDEGNLVRRDRLGLILEGDERARFLELKQESERLVALGNAYIDDQEELADVFRALSDTVLAQVAELASEVDALREELEGGEFEARAEGLRFALRRFGEALREEGEAPWGELEEAAKDARARLEEGSMARFVRLASRVQTLRDLLRDPAPEDVPTLMALLQDVAAEGIDWGSAFDGLATELEQLQGLLETEAEEIPDAVGEALDASGLTEEIEYFADLADRAAGLLESARTLFELGGDLKPLDAALRVPEAIDVDLDAAQPTALRLRRTPRLDGDTLSLRMTVLEGDEPATDPLLVDLGIETIGWHARLDPGVILARPEGGISAGDAEFRFAPLVSWLWQYTPPDDARGFWSGLARGAQFGVGPHATFLSFDPDKDVEVGLGLTFSLWKGILLFGGGYDLMADDNELYGFVGSSLIGVLQTFNDQ